MTNFLLAAATPAKTSTSSGSSSITFILFIVLMGGFFYFVMIRPQKKRATEQKQMISAIEPGDQVVTAGGVIATVKEVFEDHYVLEISPGVNVSFLRQAIARRVSEPTPDDLSSLDSDSHDDEEEPGEGR